MDSVVVPEKTRLLQNHGFKNAPFQKQLQVFHSRIRQNNTKIFFGRKQMLSHFVNNV
jgi:hypothetical protein